VPTNPPLTVRELGHRFAEVHGLAQPKISAAPYAVLWSAGLFSPMMRELRATHYQFARPFVLDSTHTERTFDLAPTAMDTALKNAG
jgi:hypothetical protein